MHHDPQDLLQHISQVIFDKKGINILVLDVRGISTMTDYFVVAEGTSDRHVRALGQTIQEDLSVQGEVPFHTEGEKTGDWLVLDYTEVVIHLFMPGLRERYALESLWKEGKIIDVVIKTAPITSKKQNKKETYE